MSREYLIRHADDKRGRRVHPAGIPAVGPHLVEDSLPCKGGPRLEPTACTAVQHQAICASEEEPPVIGGRGEVVEQGAQDETDDNALMIR